MIGDRDEMVVSETTPNGIVVRVHGDLDDGTSPALARALSAAAGGGSRRTVVDLSQVSFADSSALHTLLIAQQAHTAAGTLLVLAGPLQTALRRLLEVTNTAAAFRLADSVQEGMRS
ncbi:STAS domain-containing protein [Streptomyces sp. NPDC127584]|uniref:STAS domain-containing protein n=1 Tax=Streptomyces sp. NPDC127584 TaxID=3345403 RepID=UPI003644CB83